MKDDYITLYEYFMNSDEFFIIEDEYSCIVKIYDEIIKTIVDAKHKDFEIEKAMSYQSGCVNEYFNYNDIYRHVLTNMFFEIKYSRYCKTDKIFNIENKLVFQMITYNYYSISNPKNKLYNKTIESVNNKNRFKLIET